MTNILPQNVIAMLQSLKAQGSTDKLGQRLGKSDKPAAKRLRPRQTASSKTVNSFWQRLIDDGQATEIDKKELADELSIKRADLYSANIENYIGTTKVPLGVIGPLRVNGINANGDYFVPLATSEAALIASYGRGAEVCSKAGGISAGVVREGVLRTPAFVFDDIMTSGSFIAWIAEHTDEIKAAAESTTRFGKLVLMEPFMDVDVVF